ncbi:MAG: hypothetical protein F6K53_35675 [Moorea sp. SIO4A1]|uniref:hypothetical protein n=1 Tax=Moorena sp. SIO4A1 TaxID=2607835 RepID=UPI00144E242C|nr:hypothetical protein [Moorena sp. SIO4A1]NEQ62447.1 hypothetical protein [Moorena sp. SIO4A1]
MAFGHATRTTNQPSTFNFQPTLNPSTNNIQPWPLATLREQQTNLQLSTFNSKQ